MSIPNQVFLWYAARMVKTTTAAQAGDGARVCCTRTDEEALARLARVAKALSDPIRLGMLDVMTQGRGCCGVIDPGARGVPGPGDPEGICVCEFQEQFGLAQSKASYHLRVLKDAGLVTEETRGKWSFYAVDERRVAEALLQLGAIVGLDLTV
jgi:ArsR family transcriptional regulator, arsenate/arsenite/antimonite-responsive transcriptional repressor